MRETTAWLSGVIALFVCLAELAWADTYEKVETKRIEAAQKRCEERKP